MRNLGGLVLIVVSSIGAWAAEQHSPPTTVDFPTNVYWGDTHLHTNMSVDANGMGNRLLTPDDAYRFAKGEAVRAHNGQTVRLRRPLDFLAVTDHAVNLGVLPRLQAGDPLILSTDVGRRWAELWRDTRWSTGDVLNQPSLAVWREQVADIAGSGKAGWFWSAWSTNHVDDEQFRRSVWNEVCDNADRYNDPGEFTTFIGYEWTPATRHPKSPNFHRNMIFRDDGEIACRLLPFSIHDSDNVEDLWTHLDHYESSTGGRVLAIPHNGNLSAGKMFYPYDYDDQPIDVDYASMRHRFEPIVEMTQYKGDGETHPLISPTDEFADFETWDGPGRQRLPGFEQHKRYEYARSALKLGLEQHAMLGVNPFKFGMIGATDAHSGFASAEEDNYWGKRSLDEASPHRLAGAWWYQSGGYAAVWAKSNTRSAIFNAMARRETYATTGPRMRVRFFGGWSFEADDAHRPDFARVGYRGGVPMGGDLDPTGGDGGAPTFLVRALKDPDGAHLDRVQIIKGWRDADGGLHEAIFDVALSDDRAPGETVGDTVDVPRASYLNTIGDAELSAFWRDTAFDPEQLAFYYVRVLEIPTPRWTTHDAARFGMSIPEGAPAAIQERAYTSPIWYVP